jgi:hypothetical protein
VRVFPTHVVLFQCHTPAYVSFFSIFSIDAFDHTPISFCVLMESFAVLSARVRIRIWDSLRAISPVPRGRPVSSPSTYQRKIDRTISASSGRISNRPLCGSLT